MEDTALYRDTRLVARNEVGGNLAVFGRPVAELHQANTEREARWPQSMLATSTHDTKRGEDVRARLAVLSERPARWWPLAAGWTERLGHGVAPADALLLWQTMAGAWPLEQSRCLAYMEKAVREAGLHTTWTDPDPPYEQAVAALVARAYADRAFLAELEELVAELAPAGRVKAAALALLRLTSPGVPDTYQGTETEQLDLVDPDNRHPVTFKGDTSLKFQVTRTALRLRRDHPELSPATAPWTPPTTWSPSPAATTAWWWSPPGLGGRAVRGPGPPALPSRSISHPVPGTTCCPAPPPWRPDPGRPAPGRPASRPAGPRRHPSGGLWTTAGPCSCPEVRSATVGMRHDLDGMATMTSFELVPRGPFSLDASAAFLEGFSPAAHRAADEGGHLHLAFVPDGEEAAAGVCLRQPDGAVVGEVFGEPDPGVVREQVRRILSLDVDGAGSRRSGGATGSSEGCSAAGRGCGRSGSSRPTRRRPGR